MESLLGVEEAARRLGCHSDTIKRLIFTGRLHAVKPLGRWRIDPLDLERLIERPDRTPDAGRAAKGR